MAAGWCKQVRSKSYRWEPLKVWDIRAVREDQNWLNTTATVSMNEISGARLHFKGSWSEYLDLPLLCLM